MDTGGRTADQHDRPTEYRCYIKEVFLYATAGAVTPSRIIPSSSGQLPVPVALHARSPTLFPAIIHENTNFVNTYFSKKAPKNRSLLFIHAVSAFWQY